MSEMNFFELPTSPDKFGVVLPPSNLRKIDFSALDYDAARRSIIEYIRTYYPDDFNDFVASNGIMMLVEIIASTTAKLSLRQDLLAQEAFLPTARTEEAVINHLALINQRIRRQTPATVDVECLIDFPLQTDLRMPAGLRFQISSQSQQAGARIYYEMYKAPNDWYSDIVIPAGKKGVIAWAIEGRFSESNSETSDGTPNQQFTITEDNVLESPINIYVTVGDDTEEWLPIIEPIERYGPNDKVAEINFFDGAVVFKFGDNLAGKIPPPGSKIKFEYRIGGGKQGRIGANQISTNREIIAQPPSNAAVQVRFRNLTPSTGGTDKETLEEVKRRAPNDYSSQRSIVTASDYAQQATSFRHPVFGAVSKASVSLRSSLNANRVDVHILAEGPEDVPAIPSSGLKMGLKTYIESLNVLTDNVFVMDGEFYPVDIDMNVILDRNSDASIVKTKVESEIDKFFDLRKWEMGQPFYTSKFIDAISSVDGVAYVDLFSPSDNILASERLADPEIDGVGVNQLIIEGSRKTSYYYSKL